MTQYALLLRGVNVGTNNSLPMADLRAMLANLKCTDVRTYVQSGNAVFHTALSEAKLTSGIEAALERAMGRPIATTLRTLEQLQAIVSANPLAQFVSEPRLLCVTFLSDKPTAKQLATLNSKRWSPERVEVRGRELYSWHPAGQARSPLMNAIGKLPMGGAVTTRNWNTVLKLHQLLTTGAVPNGPRRPPS